jgi:hypothetical protein
MKRLPLLLDDKPSLLVRVGLFALVPVALILLLPILLLLVIALYLSAIFHGVRVIVTVATGKRPAPDYEMQKPHFLEMPMSTRLIESDSTSEPHAN